MAINDHSAVVNSMSATYAKCL